MRGALAMIIVLLAVGCIQTANEHVVGSSFTTQVVTSSTNAGQQPQTTVLQTTSTLTSASTENFAALGVKVTDNSSGAPLEGVNVFLGDGYYGCDTGDDGRCVLGGFSWGDYSLTAGAKGYTAYRGPIRLNPGKNELELSLEATPLKPVSFVLEGEVIDIVSARGTRSENHFVMLRIENGTDYYLFDKNGLNQRQADYAGKRVSVTGYFGDGFIGWQQQPAKGLFVETITTLG
jgi:hypothetical protein